MQQTEKKRTQNEKKLEDQNHAISEAPRTRYQNTEARQHKAPAKVPGNDHYARVCITKQFKKIDREEESEDETNDDYGPIQLIQPIHPLENQRLYTDKIRNKRRKN